MNQTNISNGASIGNRNITPSQINCWSMYIVSLPESLCVMKYLAELITLPSYQASSYNVPIYSELSLEASLSPLARNAIDERIASIKSSNLVIEAQEFGITLLLFSNLVYQSAVSISGAASALLANAGARLTEVLAFNSLRATVPQNIYVASEGTNAKTPTELTIKDLVKAKSALEKNKTKRFNRMMVRATDQVGTSPLGHTYVLLSSIDSKNSFEITLSAKPSLVVRPEQHPSIHQYADSYAFSIPIASISVVTSTEYDGKDSSGNFSDYILGKDTLYIAENSPLKGGMSIRTSSHFAYNRVSAVDYSVSFGSAVVASRIVQVFSTSV